MQRRPSFLLILETRKLFLDLSFPRILSAEKSKSLGDERKLKDKSLGRPEYRRQKIRHQRVPMGVIRFSIFYLRMSAIVLPAISTISILNLITDGVKFYTTSVIYVVYICIIGKHK